MNIQRFSPSADEAASLFVTTQPDSLAIIAWPRSVLCGYKCPTERVNWEYCAEKNIPVVYTCLNGASYFYRAGDALAMVLVTHRYITHKQVLDAMCRELQAALPALYVKSCSLQLGPARCGMAAPEQQRPDGAWLNVMEIVLHYDTVEARRALAFPDGKWDYRRTSVAEDWIHPLDNELGPEAEQIVTRAMVAAAQELMNDG